MDLTIQQLRLVLAVHDAGSFTVAAQRLHLAQSSMSRTVREVERKLGVDLFERTTRQLVTTAEGAEFTHVARRVVESFDAGINHFEGFLAGGRGRVRVAALPSLAAILLPPVISAYRQRLPDVDLSIEDGLSGEVLDRVRSGDADLAVTVVPDRLDDLDVRTIATDHFCCVHPPGHRFAGTQELTWAELAREPYIAFDRTSSIRQHADHAFRASGTSPNTVIEARNIAAVAGLVAAGLGVTAVPGLVLPLMRFADLRHRPLEPRTSRRIAIIRSPHRTLAPAARGFIDEVERTQADRPDLAPQTTWLPPG